MNPNLAILDRRSPSRHSVLARLAWKEFRQLMPLLAMLAAFSFSLHGISLFVQQAEAARDLRTVAFIGFPVLFAAGVGAMLVSQERDLKTLQWMASLPISGQYQARVKWMVGSIGLVLVWCLSGLLYAIVSLATSSRLQPKDTDIQFYLTHSVFLMFMGLACAWFCRSTLVGLVALVGATSIVSICDSVLGDNPLQATDAVRMVVLMAFCGVAFVAARLGASREYRPLIAGRHRDRNRDSRAFFDAAKLGWPRVLRPRDALAWQFAKQNQWLLLGSVGLFVFGCVVLCVNFRSSSGRWEDIQQVIVLGFGCNCFAAGVLGLSVFVGDSLHQRIRFLSDRGISQRAIWLTRQAIPMALLIAFSITTALLGAYLNFHAAGGRENYAVTFLLAGSLVSWVVYAAVQWTSQVFRSPVLSAIVAPVAAFLPVVYVGTLMNNLGVPVWVLPILFFVPFIATFRATRYWMDAQVGKWFWMEHAFWFAVVLLLPLLPAGYGILTIPSMPAKELAEFNLDAKRFQGQYANPVPLRLRRSDFDPSPIISPEEDSQAGLLGGIDSPEESISESLSKPKSAWDNPDGTNPPTKADHLPILERVREKLESFEAIVLGLSEKVSLIASTESDRLQVDVTLLRMKLESSKRTPEDEAIYRRAMRCMLSICKGIRRSTQLPMQRQADFYDAWLFRELQRERAAESLGNDLCEEIASYLRDSQGRNAARYRALVAAWDGSVLHQSNIGRLGTFALANPSSLKYANDRAVGLAAWEIKQYLFAANDAERAKHRDAIAATFGVSVSRFGMPVGSTSQYAGLQQAPCESWFGRWESEIVSLKPSTENAK